MKKTPDFPYPIYAKKRKNVRNKVVILGINGNEQTEAYTQQYRQMGRYIGAQADRQRQIHRQIAM